MSGLVWLASYPKSGNTWFRMMFEALVSEQSLDINRVSGTATIASDRFQFDHLTLIDSRLLRHAEADALRSGVYEAVARGEYRDPATPADRPAPPVNLMKAHDAYGLAPDGAPLMAAGRAAILIVRDPRAVVPSYASQRACSIDEAIEFLEDSAATLSSRIDGHSGQLRQCLGSWSAHTASWLDQADIPVHLLRYEDMKRDAAGCFADALRFAGHAVSVADAARAASLADFANLRAQEEARGFAEKQRAEASLFFRRGEAEAWREELSDAQITRIEAAHGPMMARLGYEVGAGAAPWRAAAIPSKRSGGPIGRPQ